ncbi:MAG: hypothetical protein AAGA17_10885 [Actinomycetota bacterium]
MSRQGVGIALEATEAELQAWLSEFDPTAEAVEVVVALRHRRQSRQLSGWTSWILLLGPEGADDGEDRRLARSVVASNPTGLRRLDAVRIQPGLDMIDPPRDGQEARLRQSIEYISSHPGSREEYYETQTQFSGPAVRRLFEHDRFGRFLGVEVSERLVDDQTLPPWDVVHVAGLTMAQRLRAAPHYHRAFNAAARAIGEPSAKTVMRRWSSQRTIITANVEQIFPL